MPIQTLYTYVRRNGTKDDILLLRNADVNSALRSVPLIYAADLSYEGYMNLAETDRGNTLLRLLYNRLLKKCVGVPPLCETTIEKQKMSIEDPFAYNLSEEMKVAYDMLQDGNVLSSTTFKWTNNNNGDGDNDTVTISALASCFERFHADLDLQNVRFIDLSHCRLTGYDMPDVYKIVDIIAGAHSLELVVDLSFNFLHGVDSRERAPLDSRIWRLLKSGRIKTLNIAGNPMASVDREMDFFAQLEAPHFQKLIFIQEKHLDGGKWKILVKQRNLHSTVLQVHLLYYKNQ